MKDKRKTFTVNYLVETLKDATIKAESLEEALKLAQCLTADQLDKLPGGILDESIRITGLFE